MRARAAQAPVTVGHNIQYHCIVYSYARNKYPKREGPEFRWVKLLFKNVATYGLVGLLFTVFLYKGPVIEWLKAAAAGRLDEIVFNSLGMMAGIRNPADLHLGEQILAALLVGFAMQHYYLDSKIWRVGGDAQVRRYLRV